MSSTKFNVCMVSDFFYPALGGVEMHIFQLALCLLERGHKVIVVTHAYGNRTGVRYMTNGIKVYYCPIVPFQGQVTFPNFCLFFPLIRKILIREKIQIVHAHQGTSSMGIEALMHAKTLGLRAIYTDHSLFGFADAACIHLNKLLKMWLSDIDAIISVSHTSKENITLRASMNPNIIYVIPNAVDISRFTPDPSRRYPLNTINIVYIARLTFRKGVDLLASVIPPLCKKYPELHFIIGGDGPKRKTLERMIDQYSLQKRVELLGSIPHNQVRNVLVRGHIFLNTSITEAFCIANLEAAASGLIVVSTNVGGISEALPEDLGYLADPDPDDIIRQIETVIPLAKNINSQKFHDRLKDLYSWRNVAARTEKVYAKVTQNPPLPILDRLKRYFSSGPIASLTVILFLIIGIFLQAIFTIIQPKNKIETAVNFPYQEFAENKEKYGDYKLSVLKKKN